MYSLRKTGVAACLVLIFLSVLPVIAEEYDIPDGEGYFGVYVAGEKVGFAHWSIKKVTLGKQKYYRIEMQEERNADDKKKKETIVSKAKLGIDLTAQTLDMVRKVGSRSTTIKARISGGNASITMQFGGQKPFPPRKLKVKPETMWSFCAPLCFAFKNPDPSEKAVLSRLIEMSNIVRDTVLSAEKQEITFQGEKITAWRWAGPESDIVILLDEDSNLLSWTVKNKKGVETSYVAEPEDVARSGYTYEQMAAKKAASQAKENGKKPKKGDIDLEALLEDAADEMEGEDFNVNLGRATMSFKYPTGWKPAPIGSNNQIRGIRVICGDDEDVFVNIFFAPGTEDGADSVLESVLTNLEKGGGDIQNVERKSEIQTFDWDGTDAAGIMLTFISSNTKMKTCLYAVAGEKISAVALPVCSEDSWDDYKDSIFGLLRSLTIK